MKAAVCRAFGRPLVVEEVELEAPGRGEVEVEVAACAVCHSDVLAIDGAWGGSVPVVVGHEAAGVVASIGPGVERVRPGDHVVVTLVRACGTCPACTRGEPSLCDGAFARDARPPLVSRDGEPIRQGLRTAAFAERVVVDGSQVVPIDRDVPLESAALLACGVLTGVGAVVNTARVVPGSRVVTIGTGGVGLNCVQGAALCGARTNIAIDLCDEKLALAAGFGADHAINPNRDDPREAIMALTNGRGADYVFIGAGSARAIEQGMGLVRRGGTLVVVGMTADGVKVGLEAVAIADRGLRILGSKMGSARPHQDVPMLADLYRQGRLKLDELITGRFPLDAIDQVIARVRDGTALRDVVTFPAAGR